MRGYLMWKRCEAITSRKTHCSKHAVAVIKWKDGHTYFVCANHYRKWKGPFSPVIKAVQFSYGVPAR